jgi:hypothetical protein
MANKFPISDWLGDGPIVPLRKDAVEDIFILFLKPAAHLRPVAYTFSRMLTLTVKPVVGSTEATSAQSASVPSDQSA